MGDDARNETFGPDDDLAVLGMEAEAADDGMQALEEPSTPTPPPSQPIHQQPVQQQTSPPPSQPIHQQPVQQQQFSPPPSQPVHQQPVQPTAPAAPPAAPPAPPRRAIRRAQKPAQHTVQQTQPAAQPAQPAQTMAIQPAQPTPEAGALENAGPTHAFSILQSKDMGKMLKAFEDNFGPRGLSVNDLEVITVPSGGSTRWQLKTLEGKEIYLEELVVIVVNWSERRAYWPGEFGTTKLPQCSSDDTINGRGDPGGPCDTCPMSEWGSSEKSQNGQACRLTRMLFALCAHDQEQRLPTRIQIPPSSIPGNRQFFARLATRGVSYYEAVVSLKLTAQGSARGNYAIVSETVVRRATPAEIAAVNQYRGAILGKLTHIKPRNREVMAEQV